MNTQTILTLLRQAVTTLPCKIGAGVFATYLGLGYFAVNPLAQKLVPWIAESKLASTATVAEVKFDPFGLVLTINDLKLTRKDGAPLASFELLTVNYELSGLFRAANRLQEIELVAPKVLLEVAPDGKLNWSEMLTKLNENADPKQASSASLPRLLIDRLSISKGDVQYIERNRTEPFKAVMAPFGVSLEHLSTLPDDSGNYQIAASLPEQGGNIQWKGTLGLNPLMSTGAFGLQGVQLAKLLQALPPASRAALPLQISAGELQSKFDYRFAMVEDSQDKAKKRQPTAEASVKNFSLRLDKLRGSKTGIAGSDLALGQLSAQVPALDFAQKNATHLTLKNASLSLQDIAIQLDQTALFTLPQAKVQGMDFDLASNSVKIADVQLDNGALKAKRLANGSVDWQRLLATPTVATAAISATSASKPSKPLKLDIGSIKLAHWQADYQDAAFKHPLSASVQDINLGLAVSSKDDSMRVEKLDSAIGPVTLKSTLYPQPAATLDKLTLSAGETGAINLQDHSVTLQSLILSGLKTDVLREEGKPLNWQAMLEPAAAHASAKASNNADTSKPWTLALATLGLENSAVHFEDKTTKLSTAKPVVLDVQNAAIAIKNASLDLSKPLPVSARFGVKQGGQFDASGNLALAPLSGNLQIRLAALSLKPFAPYVNQFAVLRLNSGSASLNGKLALKAGKNDALASRFTGGFSVDKLGISEEDGGATFLSWKTLASNSLTLTLAPNQLHMDELRIVDPVGKVIIYQDKSINIKRALRSTTATATASATAAAPAPLSPLPSAPLTAKPAAKNETTQDADTFPIAIDRIKVLNGEMDFADLSLTPQFGTHINSLSGVINGISTRQDTVAQVELDGKVDEYGSARIRGGIQPFRATDYTDLKLAFHNLEMSNLTPYSGKFAGRKIDSGKLSVDLEYNIKNRQLAGQNKFIINKLKLGEQVDSPDAMNLPLNLAIALLEDSDGVIDLDLPVSGSLDDPQFSYGRIVWKAITNVLTSLITSPFRALGSLLGISSDKLEAVSFDPGSSAIAPPEQEKLNNIAQAIQKRPALVLSVVPSYDPVADRKALQRNAIRREIAQELGLKTSADEAPGPVDTNNSKVQSILRKLARERSPDAKNRSMFTKLTGLLDLEKPTDPAAYTGMLDNIENWTVISDDSLKALAESRADNILAALKKNPTLPAEKLSKTAAEAISGSKDEVKVKMNLGVGK